MKWGSKRSSPPSFHSSLITRVIPASWFSKFKPKGGIPEIGSGKKQQRGKLDFPTWSTSLPSSWREARFYSVDDDDDDAYWRLSFGAERAEGRRRTARIHPLWYDSDDEFLVPRSSFKSFGLREIEFPRGVQRSINDMVLDIDIDRDNILQTNGGCRKKKLNRGAQLKKKEVNNPRSRKLSHRVARRKKAELETGPDDGERKSSKQVESDISPIEPENMDQMKEDFQDSDEKDYVFAVLDGEGSNAASKEIKVKTESQVKSAKISRRSHSRKIKQNRKKAYASRSECRIQVLEDMKKARTKLKKKERKEQLMEGCTIFNSFAVVKSSFNPQQDFRDSMVEMIREKGIRQPEELEELLACYLTLNPDGFHGLIIKVFQQVWFELSDSVS